MFLFFTKIKWKEVYSTYTSGQYKGEMCMCECVCIATPVITQLSDLYWINYGGAAV